METFRSALAFSYSNLSRWKKDYRVWLIFIFTALLIVQSLKGYVVYGMAEGRKMTFCMLPLLFQSCEVPLRSSKILWHVGFILLLCDAPFIYGNAPYMVMRSGRRKWCAGECIYIFEVSFIYMAAITLISSAVTLPVISFENDWGAAINDYVSGTESMTLEEIYTKYPLELGRPYRLNMLYPFFCQAYTFLTGFLSFFVLGLLVYVINLVQKNILWGIGAACGVIFLDPLLTYLAKPAAYWLQAFSPVCWTSVDCINLLGRRFFISVPFVITAGLVIISVLLVLILFLSKRVMIAVREEY